jgi:hypothetical protein
MTCWSVITTSGKPIGVVAADSYEEALGLGIVLASASIHEPEPLKVERLADLYWSQQGRIACDKHTPRRGSDTWRWGRWRRMSLGALSGHLRETGKSAECGTCAHDKEVN